VSIAEITGRVDQWWADERKRETESISDYKSDAQRRVAGFNSVRFIADADVCWTVTGQWLSYAHGGHTVDTLSWQLSL